MSVVTPSDDLNRLPSFAKNKLLLQSALSVVSHGDGPYSGGCGPVALDRPQIQMANGGLEDSTPATQFRRERLRRDWVIASNEEPVVNRFRRREDNGHARQRSAARSHCLDDESPSAIPSVFYIPDQRPRAGCCGPRAIEMAFTDPDGIDIDLKKDLSASRFADPGRQPSSD